MGESLASAPPEEKSETFVEAVNSVDVRATDRPTRGGDVEIAGPEYRVYKRRWIGLVMLMIMNIVVSWGWLTFAPVSNLTAEWFSLSSESPVNWLSTVILFSYVVATPAVIYLLGRYSIKPALLVAALLLLAGNWIRFAGTQTKRFGVTMVGQILIGFSQPFFLNAPPHYSDLWFTSRGRVSATALASLSNPFGAALGQFLDPMFANRAEKLPDMVLYVAIIASVAVLGWAVFPAHPPSPPGPSGNAEKLSAKESLEVFKRSGDFWILWAMFTVYLGLFSAFTTLLNQFMLPRGYSMDEAGITGALLIVAGLICSAIVSPIIDRTHSYFLAIRVAVPVIAACYLAFIWVPSGGKVAGPWAVGAILGAASFAILPLSLELSVEFTHPVAPEWTSSLMWCGGQLLGGVLIIAMGAMKDDGNGGDMKWALVLQAVLACVAVPGAALIGRKSTVLRRLQMDQSV